MMPISRCIAFLAAISASAVGVAQIVVDNSGSARDGKVGGWSSIVARGGDVAISYYCEWDPPDTYALRFAWWNGAGWEWTTVDPFGGSDTSMARGTDGAYQIVYSSWLGIGWATGSATNWNVQTVPIDPALAPVNQSLVLDSANHPHVAYMNLANGGDYSLRYTYFDGTHWVTPDGAGGIVGLNLWTPTIGFSNSYLALDAAGNPHITFAQPSDPINAFGPIRYATLQGSTWQFESIGQMGQDPSLAIGSDNVPRIVFNSDTGLTYAYKVGGAWGFETIVPGQWANSFALTLSDTNLPHVAFGMTANEDMYLAQRSGGGWTVTKIDGDGSPSPDQLLGRYGVSIDVDETGTPHTAYMDIQIYGMTFRSNLKYYGSTTPTCIAITGNPSPQAACPGDAADFNVLANGTGTLTYQWRRDSIPLADGPTGSGSELLGTSGPQLTVFTVGVADVGAYDCVVSSDCGSAISSAAGLSLGTPLSISAQPAVVAICPPATAQFSVSASSPAPLGYQWRRNGVAIGDGPTGTGSTISGSNAALLTITQTGAADVGTYDCIVTAGCSNLTSNPAGLTIQCGGGCDGDLNEDGMVDLRDLATLLAHYGDDGASYGDGDLNGDTFVNLSDLALLLSHYGTICP